MATLGNVSPFPSVPDFYYRVHKIMDGGGGDKI